MNCKSEGVAALQSMACVKCTCMLVQSKWGSVWEPLSGKGLGVEKPLLASHEAPQQNPRESDLKKSNLHDLMNYYLVKLSD